MSFNKKQSKFFSS